MKLKEVVEAGIQLINGSGRSRLAQFEKGMEWMNGTSYVKIVEQHDLATAFFIAERRPFEQENVDVVDLLKLLSDGFNLSELKDLSFRLGVDYENLAGEGKQDKARELILYMQRNGRVLELVALCDQIRPNFDWPVQSKLLPYISKLDKAVVVDFTHPALGEVAEYLSFRKMDANVILFTNKIPYPESGPLLPEDSWDDVIHTFAKTMHHYKGTRTHYFLSAPAALAFGLGSIRGTVENAQVYHYQNNSYQHVFNTRRELK
jgi:hypothetical protein